MFLSLAEMATKGLPKVADVENEKEYGYVFGVSGPGKLERIYKSVCVFMFLIVGWCVSLLTVASSPGCCEGEEIARCLLCVHAPKSGNSILCRCVDQ